MKKKLMNSLYKKALKCYSVVTVIVVLLLVAHPVQAATFTIDPQSNGNFFTSSTAPISLPDEEVVIRGTGEPGAIVSISTLKAGKTIYTTQTTVDNQGNWQATLPKFPEGVPDQLVIHTDVQLTATKVLETVAVTGLSITNAFVLLQLLLERMIRGLQVIGLLRRKKTKGFVFDTKTKRPVPFALLTIQNEEKASGYTQPLLETVVSDVYGFFQVVNLPYGRYSINVAHPDYIFPSKQPKPWYTSPLDFYRGETLEFVSQDDLDICFIPLDPSEKSKFFHAYWLNFKVIIQVLTKLSETLVIPMGILSFITVWFWPTFLNLVFCAWYIFLLILFLYERHKTRAVEGDVTLDAGGPIPQAVVKILHPNASELVKVILTDNNGHFKSRVAPGEYQVLVSKPGLLPDIGQGMTIEIIKLDKDQTKLHYKMSLPPDPIEIK